MPDVMNYFARMSYLLRQGAPANDIAVLLPEEDAQARFRPGHVSVTDEMRNLLGPDLVPAILDAGYNLDFIDSAAIDKLGIGYPVLVMPTTERLPLTTYKRIQDYVQHGGLVIAIKSLPTRAPGVTEGPRDSAAVVQISQTLSAPDAKSFMIVPGPSDLGAAIVSLLKPDVAISPATPEVGFIHRRLAAADVYFIANTDNTPHAFDATFRTTMSGAEWWDPFTGKVTGAGSGSTIHFDLAPYESRVVVFTKHPALPPREHAASPFAPIDLSHNWKITFDKSGTSETMQTLQSWTVSDAKKYYSGSAIYTRTVEVPEAVAKSGRVILDFGEGTPVARELLHQAGTRTWYDPPIREVAVVSVNGKPAGDLWHPPYRLDVTALIHAGANELHIVVANTAINELASRAAPDYRLLNLRYGEKFTPQDMDHLEPLPSGILGTVRLISGQ
jgi:hypothetical protein